MWKRRRRAASGCSGVDWEVANGAYRIARLVSGAAWDADVRSPLAQPGVDVKAGEYVLAVNGVPLETSRDPWAAFEGLADAAVVLTVNSKPATEGSRQVIVKCLPNETELRFREWIEQRRKRVDEATGDAPGTSTSRAPAWARKTSWSASSWRNGGRTAWSSTSDSTAGARFRIGSSSCSTGRCWRIGPCATDRTGNGRRWRIAGRR